MPPSPRRALALDFGRVLTLDPDRKVFHSLLDWSQWDPQSFQAAYSERRHDYDRGSLHAADYWGSVLRASRPQVSDSEVASLVPRLIDADFASWAQPRLTLHRILETALDQGVPMAIVSNMPAGIGDRFVESWPWLARIPHRFFSADFGLVKPDEAFYLHVLSQTGWRAPDVLFVDDLPANIEAASRHGFATLLFTGSAEDLQTIQDWCRA